MKLKIRTILILLGIIIYIGMGCITEKNTSTYLKYDFNTGDEFVYDVQNVKLVSNNTDAKKIHIKMIFLNDTYDNFIFTRTIMKQISEENKTFSEYTTKMEQNGTISEIFSNNLIIPEIQPELPNTIIYPEKKIRKGDLWTTSIKKSGNLITPVTLTEYNISGIKNYTCLGFKKISVDAGLFECVGIKSDTNYTLNRVINNTNGTVSIIITGNVLGEDWVDLKSGFLVKSKYNVDSIIMTDLSEAFEQIGFEQFYRETPMTSQIVSELIEKNEM